MRTLKVGAVLLAGLAALSGCFAFAANRETQQQDHDRKVSRVEVTLDSGDVEVRAGADNKVAITRKLEWGNSKPAHREEWDGDTLRVHPPTCSNNCSISYVLTVPAAVSAKLRTESGSITVRDVTGELNLETDSGDVRADNPAAALFAKADSGTVTATGARSPKAELRTDSGDIKADFAAAPGSVTANAGSGTIEIGVPKEPAGYKVDAKVESGKRTVSVTEEPGSPRSITAHTDSGDVTLRYA
ncbi:DUF4097 family beta strand repeat-containing protein [Crossiella sp. CA-258035]|uniref:DUF4097 family beta strand repeat-containing protein n=1 Tax=Crossiella sp. CA-258035 TaxID=2981138 RepID=UPI0024BCC089|nr:DUF4097 family beta strand repeat-containing protein [Crossiella sp. CA-258035]WHT16578.1 DUF4097 family beta strand repeat-containing protein [Crossiella sp. CA-258035]